MQEKISNIDRLGTQRRTIWSQKGPLMYSPVSRSTIVRAYLGKNHWRLNDIERRTAKQAHTSMVPSHGCNPRGCEVWTTFSRFGVACWWIGVTYRHIRARRAGSMSVRSGGARVNSCKSSPALNAAPAAVMIMQRAWWSCGRETIRKMDSFTLPVHRLELQSLKKWKK